MGGLTLEIHFRLCSNPSFLIPMLKNKRYRLTCDAGNSTSKRMVDIPH